MITVGKDAARDRNRSRAGWTGRAQADRVQTQAVRARLEATAKPGQNQVGSASWVHVACLFDGAQQKLKLVCFFYPIIFVN